MKAVDSENSASSLCCGSGVLF